jgi:hypothetical protein
MATLSRKQDANPERREDWMRTMRFIYLTMARIARRQSVMESDDGLHRAEPDRGRAALAELRRLEAGGDVVVAGWEVGRVTDYSRYVLAGDGTLTPFPAVMPKKGRTK